MAEEKKEYKFPSEIIDLPSGGKVYPEDSPLREGKLEIKYMTAKEEDILTSQNLISKGVVIDRLLNSLILTKGVVADDLIIGDKNGLMVAARILAYGPEYEAEVSNPNTGETFNHVFNLAECEFKKLPDEVDGDTFEFELPVSKHKITFKLLNGKDEQVIKEDIEAFKKLNQDVIPELTTRLRHVVKSVDGDETPATINIFVQNMLSKDSLELRKEITRVSPDINMERQIEIGGEMVSVLIPMTSNFFWPNTEA